MELSKFIQTNRFNTYQIQLRSTAFWSSFFIVLTAFAIPISSTLRSISMSLSVVFLLFDSVNRMGLRSIVKQKSVFMAFVLFALSLLACLWSAASLHDQWTVLEKYSKLLYLPFFILVFRDENTRNATIHAFLLAMFITCVLLLLKASGVVHYGGDDPGQMFRNHIMTGYMMVFAAYLAAHVAYYETRWRRRLAYTLLCFMLSYQVVFTGTGRMAYMTYFLLAVLWFFQVFSWRKAILLASLGGVLFAGAYALNPTMQFLAHQVKDDWGFYHHDKKDTSLGFRLQFHTYAYDLFKRHPWLGNGTGGFTHAFQVENLVPEWSVSRPRLLEPHSQYWLVAAEFGVVGLLVFGLFLGSLISDCWHVGGMRDVACAALLLLGVGNLTDSLLLYSGTGYFFLLFVGLCLASHPKISSTLCSHVAASDAAKPPPSPAKAGAIQT